MTKVDPLGDSALENLELILRLRAGEFTAAKAGISLVLYYSKPMRELANFVRNMLERYIGFIPANSIQSSLSPSGVWRPFSPQGLGSAIRRLTVEGADYRSIHLSSGSPASVGAYGFHFFGSNFLAKGVNPLETCACVAEFPVQMLKSPGVDALQEFVADVVSIEPFESGHCGYAFNHLARTWREQALTWIAQQAPRYIGFDIGYDAFRDVAKGRVVNVSWMTLLGNPVVDVLGGDEKIRSMVSHQVSIRKLPTGLMLIASDRPPIGDVNRGARDIGALKEVAAITKTVRAKMEIGFGGDSFRQGWQRRFD